MTSTRLNYNQLVPKPIKDIGYFLNGSFLFKPMANNLLQGFCFEKVKTNLYVSAFVIPLFMKNEFINLTFSKRLKGRHTLGTIFPIEANFLEESIKEIRYVLLKNEKIISDINSVKDFILAFDIKNQESSRYYEGLIYSSYFCDEKNKDNLYQLFLKIYEENDGYNINWMKIMKKDIDLMKGLYEQRKKDELISFFNENIDYSIKQLGLVKYARDLKNL